ncbi:hypothetical protein ZWY2020_026608 [Hordeum vulgare]|nr:hypothetical protein ZWY2020_026608 [Hordeum vulgare]
MRSARVTSISAVSSLPVTIKETRAVSISAKQAPWPLIEIDWERLKRAVAALMVHCICVLARLTDRLIDWLEGTKSQPNRDEHPLASDGQRRPPDDRAGGGGDAPVPPTGAAAAATAAGLPALRPRGDDAAALLPGSLPLHKLRVSSISHLLPVRTTYRESLTASQVRWLSGELLLCLSSPGQMRSQPWLCRITKK